MYMTDFLKADDMDEYSERKKFFILHPRMSRVLLSKISPRFSSFCRLPVIQLMLRTVIYSHFMLKLKRHFFFCLETTAIIRIFKNSASPSSLLKGPSRYFYITGIMFLSYDLPGSYLLRFIQMLL